MVLEAYEELWLLLEEWERQWPAHKSIADKRRDSANQDIKNSLVDWFLSGRQETPVAAAVEWWKRRAVAGPAAERFRQLDQLLDYLDDRLSQEVVERWHMKRGTLILGRRWWNAVARQRSGKNGPLDGEVESYSQWPFHHIRMINDSVRVEWVDYREHSSSFPPFTDSAIRIGLCPLSGDAVTRFVGTTKKEDRFGFRSDGVRGPNAATDGSPNRAPLESDDRFYEAELRDCVRWAREEGIHVLLLPELAVCPAGRDILRGEIERDPGQLCLVVPGSFHAPDSDGVWRNSAPIWVIATKRLASLQGQNKLEKFRFLVTNPSKNIELLAKQAKDNGCTRLEEDIEPGDSVIIVNTPIGLFGVSICKDVLTVAKSRLHQTALETIDHWLIPSMTVAGNFVAECQSAVRQFCTAAYFVNAAQVVEPSNHDVDLAFWCLPPLARRERRQVRFRRPPKKIPEPWKADGVAIEAVEKRGHKFEDPIPSELVSFL